MRIEVISIFPELFERFLTTSLVGRAIAGSKLKVGVHDLRDFTSDRHHSVDDEPYGGGKILVGKPDCFVISIADRIITATLPIRVCHLFFRKNLGIGLSGTVFQSFIQTIRIFKLKDWLAGGKQHARRVSLHWGFLKYVAGLLRSPGARTAFRASAGPRVIATMTMVRTPVSSRTHPALQNVKSRSGRDSAWGSSCMGGILA